MLGGVVRGLDFEILQIGLTPETGVLQVSGAPNLLLRLTVGRFELENDQLQLVEERITGPNFGEIITQLGVSVRKSVTIQPAGSVPCVGCLYISYETDNDQPWNSATFQIFVTQVELVSH
jgi:hypothetical protein